MVYDLIYFIIIILSILIAAYLLLKLKPAKFSLHTKFLAAYFLLNAFCFSFYLIIKHDWISYVPLLYKIPAPITYLIAPAAYFHVRFIVTRNPKLKLVDSLHLLPFLVFFISYLPFYLQDISIKSAYVNQLATDLTLTYTDNVGLIPESINGLGRILLPLLYIIWQWILLYSEKAKQLKHKEQRLYAWVYNFVLLQSLFHCSLIATVLASYYFLDELGTELIGDVSTIFTISFFFVLSIYLFWNQSILRKLKYFTPDIRISDNKSSDKIDLQYITTLVYNEKIFKQKENDLAGISKKTGIPKAELSNLINTEFSNFNTWINDIKTRYSIELIKESYLEKYSIEALAEKCGFNSKKTFYRAFKARTGKTPPVFSKNYLKEKT